MRFDPAVNEWGGEHCLLYDLLSSSRHRVLNPIRKPTQPSGFSQVCSGGRADRTRDFACPRLEIGRCAPKFMRRSGDPPGPASRIARRHPRHTACLIPGGGHRRDLEVSTARQKRQHQLAVTGAIGHEHFMAGVRMLYACRYRDALNHFQEAIVLEPAAKGYLSYLGLAVAHADRKFTDAEQLCRRAIETEYHRPEHYHNLCEV